MLSKINRLDPKAGFRRAGRACTATAEFVAFPCQIQEALNTSAIPK